MYETAQYPKYKNTNKESINKYGYHLGQLGPSSGAFMKKSKNVPANYKDAADGLEDAVLEDEDKQEEVGVLMDEGMDDFGTDDFGTGGAIVPFEKKKAGKKIMGGAGGKKTLGVKGFPKSGKKKRPGKAGKA